MPEDVFLIVSAAMAMGANPMTSVRASKRYWKCLTYFSFDAQSLSIQRHVKANRQACPYVGDILIIFRRSPLKPVVINIEYIEESIDQEDRGSAPARMPGKRDTCRVV